MNPTKTHQTLPDGLALAIAHKLMPQEREPDQQMLATDLERLVQVAGAVADEAEPAETLRFFLAKIDYVHEHVVPDEMLAALAGWDTKTVRSVLDQADQKRH